MLPEYLTDFSSDETVCITDIESAINHFRRLRELNQTDPFSASPDIHEKLFALAEVYGSMTHFHFSRIHFQSLPSIAKDAWLEWYHTTPDTPCIAICSTAQGDSVCKGCGRTEAEIQNWPCLSPLVKRNVWNRIVSEGTSWRFNRYADRVQDAMNSEDKASISNIDASASQVKQTFHARHLNWSMQRIVYRCSPRNSEFFALTF